MNPHKPLKHLYGARMMAQYRGAMLGELSPHVYAIAEQVAQPFLPETSMQVVPMRTSMFHKMHEPPENLDSS